MCWAGPPGAPAASVPAAPADPVAPARPGVGKQGSSLSLDGRPPSPELGDADFGLDQPSGGYLSGSAEDALSVGGTFL